jgi:arylsulfatase A-like enzyme
MSVLRPSLSRRTLLGSSALLPAAAQSTANARPNIVFVIADDLRHDGLGCTGHPFAKTPHIDRIAREGAKFTNFFTAIPLCSPSRASVLTGLYPHSHRITNNDKQGLGEISHTLPTFPRILHEAGYETAFIGKWHMGFDDTRRPGFDHWVSFHAQGLYVNPVVNVDGERHQLRGYMTDFLNRKAVEFLSKPRQRPFVLYLSHKAVHYPYQPAARHESLYRQAKFAAAPPVAGDLEGKPVMRYNPGPLDVLGMEGATPEPQEPRRGRPTDQQSVVRDQARCLASVDEGMGQLFEALKRTGQLDNTVIVFTSDNGYLMGEHGQFDQKRFAWEESIRVPLLMRFPKLIPAGSRREQMTLNIDLAPTFLELGGAKPYSALHGKSLVPVLRDERAPLRDAFLCEYFLEKFVPAAPEWKCVRTARWKYIRYTGHQTFDELYDLRADPRELRNVVGEAANAEVLKDLKEQLARLLAETTESFG